MNDSFTLTVEQANAIGRLAQRYRAEASSLFLTPNGEDVVVALNTDDGATNVATFTVFPNGEFAKGWMAA